MIIVTVDQDVAIDLFIILAALLNESVAREQLVGHGRHPHKCLLVICEQLELACALKDEYSAVDIVGQLALSDLGQ